MSNVHGAHCLTTTHVEPIFTVYYSTLPEGV